MKKTFLAMAAVGMLALFSFYSETERTPETPITNEVMAEFPEMEYTYYESLEEFTSAVIDGIYVIQSQADASGSPHGFLFTKNENGYGMSLTSDFGDTGVEPGDVEMCGDCGTDLDYEHMMIQLQSITQTGPCWGMIAWTGGVWGWEENEPC